MTNIDWQQCDTFHYFGAVNKCLHRLHRSTPWSIKNTPLYFAVFLDGFFLHFLPSDSTLARYMLSSCVGPSVCHKLSLYQNS